MTDPVRKFEIWVLRPLWIFFVAGIGLSAVQGRWALAAGGVIACFLVGVIGHGLHPKLSVRDVAAGPTSGAAAQLEAAQSTLSEKTWLVGRACTSVGLLVGIAAAVILWRWLVWRWYVA